MVTPSKRTLWDSKASKPAPSNLFKSASLGSGRGLVSPTLAADIFVTSNKPLYSINSPVTVSSLPIATPDGFDIPPLK